ncbi:MAG: NifU N-terminal domain-containing protein [Tepidisphaeraceae bacterium]
MPFTVIDAQPTPNPNALKYTLDKPIAADKPESFLNADDARSHPVAAALFAIPGVVGVLLLHDFVTLNKTAAATWKKITPEVKKVLGS